MIITIGDTINKSITLLVLSILSGCSGPIDDDYNEFGEYFFSMDCSWISHEDELSTWWCEADVSTTMITGYLFLELVDKDTLAFCGEDLILNTGYSLHDDLVVGMTQNKYSCIFSREINLGNEFDWIWYDEERRLSLIWRPEGEDEKHLSLFIDYDQISELVNGDVFYKEH